MRRLLLLSALGGCAQTPADGPLPSGFWGGAPDPVALRVAADGTASLEVGCSEGESAAAMEAVGGLVRATFSFDDGEGAYDVLLDGETDGRRLIGTLTSDDERFDRRDVYVELGAGRVDGRCSPPPFF